jgi:hypothetical protein
MLGEKLGEETGKVTLQRVIPNGGATPKMETTFQANIKLLGIEGTNTATYWSALRPDGTLYGEGHGLVMGKGGEMASWIGQGIGIFKKDGALGFRGAVYYSTTASKWTGLNNVAAIFEFDIDNQGNTRSQTWEWK